MRTFIAVFMACLLNPGVLSLNDTNETQEEYSLQLDANRTTPLMANGSLITLYNRWLTDVFNIDMEFPITTLIVTPLLIGLIIGAILGCGCGVCLACLLVNDTEEELKAR